MADPWSEARAEKKGRVEKNLRNRFVHGDFPLRSYKLVDMALEHGRPDRTLLRNTKYSLFAVDLLLVYLALFYFGGVVNACPFSLFSSPHSMKDDFS